MPTSTPTLVRPASSAPPDLPTPLAGVGSAAPDAVWRVSAIDLFDVLTNTLLAAGHDATMPVLCTVRLTVTGERLHAVATDRYRIHHDSAPLISAPFQPAPVEAILIHRGDVERLLRALRPLTRLRDIDMVTLVVPPVPGTVDRSGRVVTVELPDWSTLRLLADSHTFGAFPDVERFDAAQPDWQPTDRVRFNPAYLAVFTRLTHGGRRIPTTTIGLRFRAPRPAAMRCFALSAVRVTTGIRPSFYADVMPIATADPAWQVTCPACPDLTTRHADEAAASSAAGWHDHTYHDGTPTAEPRPLPEGPDDRP